MDRTYRLVISERRMCHATKINHVSPKILAIVLVVRSNSMCMHNPSISKVSTLNVLFF
jgi:hypothetical protein